MKSFTPSGCKLSAYLSMRTPLNVIRKHRFKLAFEGSFQKHFAWSLVWLFIACFQCAFAAGPVTGKVTNNKGEPLAGVSVQVKGIAAGTSTNAEGRYNLNVADNKATLIFSYVGFILQEVPLNGRYTIDVTMAEESKALDDVVVVGYGRQKKVNLVGAVATVNVDEKITSRALPNISSGLEGLVPGLAVTQTSGMAGNNGASLIIRGLGTINNAGPLIVVDGMPDVDINRININDIETISVLKDATSASVYGSRAANGVILITTKSGKGMSKTSITLSSNGALTVPTKDFKFLADYPRSLTLAQRRAAVNTLASNYLYKNGTIDQWMALGMIDPLKYPNTDWWNIISNDGALQNYNASASGGSDKSNFFISIGLRDEKGLQLNNTYKQYNARFSYDYKMRDNMNVGVKFNGNWSNYLYSLLDGFTDATPTNTGGFDMQYAISGITPYDPASGYFGGVMAYGEDPQAYNPYTVYINNLNHTTRQEANTNAYFDWTPVKGLTGRIEYALNYYNAFAWNASTPNTAFNFQTNSFGSRVYVGANAGVSNATNTGYKTMMSGRLNYHTNFGENHDLSALLVYSEEFWYDRYQGSSRNDRFYPTLHEIDAALTDIQTTGGNSSSEGLRSYIGRVNYTAFNKYLLEANFRSDGSSKFIPGSQYGFFPSLAVGWRFTEENFLRSFTDRFLSSGKVRVSYGSLGNNSSVGRYEQQYTVAANNYIYGTTVSRGFVNSKFINRFLSWETTTVLNAGIDLAFFNNRLTATVDYYDRLTTGMIRGSDLSVLLSGAYNAPRTNIGDMRNRGIEGDFGWKDRIGKLNYGISLNASYNKSRIEKWAEYLGRGATYNGNTVFLNMPYNYVYTYKDQGIAQTWQDVYNATPQGAQPGDILRKDVNGDGRIDGNDQVALTNTQRDRPTTYFALNGYVSFRGFDVGFLFQGSAGRKEYWINAFNNPNFGVSRYAATENHLTQPWSLENRAGNWPRIGGSGNNTTTTNFWLDDMSFLRFKNIQLGYSVPVSLLRKVHINNLRFVASAENLHTFTSYRGLDPEKTGNASDLYPLNKSYSLGINLGL